MGAIRLAYYRSRNCNVFKTRQRTMKLEIQIQELDKESEPNWEGMGVDRPKGKRAYKFRRCMIDTYDIEYVKEYTDDKSILKCTWMEVEVIVVGSYDDLTIKINDLENSYLEFEDETE